MKINDTSPKMSLKASQSINKEDDIVYREATIVCPVCEETASALVLKLPTRSDVCAVICEKCGFKWNISKGDMIKHAEEYVKKHPIESCFRAL